MLGKLLKYDFKEKRILLPIYGLSIGFLLISLILLKCGAMDSKNPIVMMLSGLQFFGTVISLLAVLVSSFVIVIVNFGKQTIGAQGQIAFTLPVTVDQFLCSKLISGFTVIMAAFAYLIGCFFAMGLVTNSWEVLFAMPISNEIVGWAIFYVLIMIIGTLCSQLMYYASIALSGKFSQNRILGSIVAFLCINFALQFAMFILMIIGGVWFYFFYEGYLTATVLENMMPTFILLVAVIYGVLTASFYFITRNAFSKNINLP